MIRAIVVADPAYGRAGLRAMLEAEGDILVIGEAGAAGPPLHTDTDAWPDVAVIAVSAGGGATHTIPRIHARWPGTKILVLIPATGENWLETALEAHVTGFVPADAAATELASAVRAVAAGESLIHPAMVEPVIARIHRRRTEDPVGRLSPSERIVLELLIDGKTNREIASELHLSATTVKKRVSSILSKLEVSRRGEAAAYMLKRDDARPEASLARVTM